MTVGPFLIRNRLATYICGVCGRAARWYTLTSIKGERTVRVRETEFCDGHRP